MTTSEYPLIIPDRAREYLIHQRGAINDLKGDLETWEEAFYESLGVDWANMWEALPLAYKDLMVVADIGSGLGAIDISIHHFYEQRAAATAFVLVDGIDDPPEPRKGHTHSNAAVALDFLDKNGVERVKYVPPADFDGMAVKLDIVLSLCSWCFHYEPNVYLPSLLPKVHADTVFIVDFRKDRKRWQDQISQYLTVERVLWDRPKATRVAMRLRRPSDPPLDDLALLP